MTRPPTTGSPGPIPAIDRQTMASDPETSSWVAASAGTGKTHVLTSRVLRLMLAGAPPERILCLTFTKTAAAEMANRLHRRLGEWAVMDDAALRDTLFELTGRPGDLHDTDLARRLFCRVLDSPGGMAIQTIHAFCQSLLARFPIEALLPPHFAVLDERTADELLAEARERVLAEDVATGGSRSAVLAAHVDEERYMGLMRTLTAERARLQRLARGGGGLNDVLDAMRARLGLAPDDDPDDVRRHAVAEESFDGAELYRIAEAMAEGSKTDRQSAARVAAWIEQPGERVAALDDYMNVFLTADGAPRARLVTKQTLAIVPEAADLLAGEQARLVALDQKLRALAVVEASAAVLGLGLRLIDRYEDEKHRRGLVDFDDLILATRNLLANPARVPWVLYKLDGGIDHVLIDEAQDTNPEQWEIVRAMTEEFFSGEGAREIRRTVFAVGDPKQSIYGFQRADPQGFIDMESHFQACAGAVGETLRPVDLILSFRSTPAVLDIVDEVFADEAARDGVIAPGTTDRHEPFRRADGGLVELWPPEVPEEAEAVETWAPPVAQERVAPPLVRLAEDTATQISSWLDTGEELAAERRPIEPGDIMILVQRRGPFIDEVVRRLKQKQVPVAGIDRMVLAEQLAVMDLLALGRFTLLPEDDLNLAALLKSPLIGLDEAALYRCAHDRAKGHNLWRSLIHRAQGDAELAEAHRRLSAWRAAADFTAPYEFFSTVLDVDDGRRRLLERLGREADEAIDEFLALTLAHEQQHTPSLQGLLHWIETGRGEVKRDLDRGRGEVRIMTVHGAKGQEAPIVILTDTVRKPRPDLPLYFDDGAGGKGRELLYWVPRTRIEPDHCSELKAAATREREREYRRLLYVAMTRARDRLYVAGWQVHKNLPEGCWYDLIARAMERIGRPVSLADGREMLRYESPQLADAVRKALPEDLSIPEQPRPDWLEAPAPAEPVPPRPLAPSGVEAEAPPVASPLGPGQAARFRRGNLLHRLLQHLPEVAPAERAALTERLLIRAGVTDDAARDGLAGEALAVLEGGAFAPLFAPGSRAEVPITGLVGGHVVTGQIDRLAVTDEAVLIVDYKSNRPPPAAVADVSETYLAQLALYRALLAQVYPGRRLRAALLWTAAPRLMEIPDALLDRHLP